GPMQDPMTPEPFPSWDDFRFFLATSEAGSFSKAAGQLGMTQPTISRRIESLEQRLGVRLFDRLPSGVALTTRGESILDAARHIESAVREIHRSVIGSDKRLEGPVRISVTDGLATYWMTPRLGELLTKHPGISIEFQCSIEPADVLKMESDLSIQSRMPEAGDLIAAKLGTFHFVPWASPGYLEQHGRPRRPEELLLHRLLDHRVHYQEEGEWSDWFGLARAANLVTYMTNSSSSLISAIQSGLGIGMLPTYACECVDGIVPLDLDLRTYSEIRLVCHPDIQDTARVRAVIDWTKGLFDHKIWPWFRDEFYPPTRPEAKCGRVKDSRDAQSDGPRN
ncbi:MAG: LysR family transcriptional regulator, partial [Rhodospirillales bacterium]|nr:LysR family transcriptional regulator [Rhodospirillales bacterium]